MTGSKGGRAGKSLHLIARSTEDAEVISALLQDAFLTRADMRLDRPRRRFAALVDRIRWEDAGTVEQEPHPGQRVRSLLTIEDVQVARTRAFEGLKQGDILSVLTLFWQPTEDGMGVLILHLSDERAVALDVEALEIRLEDVAEPQDAAHT